MEARGRVSCELAGLPKYVRAGKCRVTAERDFVQAHTEDLLADLDAFKPINDSYGHEAGDRVLRCVARVLRESARADDLVARYGGEEFVLLMSSDLEDAVEVADRVCQAVERECSPERDASLSRQITVSLGIAPLTEDTQMLELLIGAADREMYRAKRAGKNRISVMEAP